MIKRIYYVYVLFRPSGTPCYVGKGQGDRWLDTRNRNRHLAAIITRNGGPLPGVKVREDLTEADAHETEIALIKAIGRVRYGGPLVNFTDGGEGVSGLKHSAETRARLSAISASHTGWQHTAETRAKLKRAAKLRGVSQKALEAAWAASRGRKHSDDERSKRAGSLKGRVVSEESRRKNRQSNLGQKRTDDARAKMSAAHKGKKLPATVRENMKAAQIARWASRGYDYRAAAEIRWSDASFREKFSEALRGSREYTPEYRAKLRASARKRWDKARSP